MGLLLIENKELTANTEDLSEALSLTQETVKREEAAHFMAVSEVEKRADNLRKALDFEKRCWAGLEKSLRELDEENKQVQLRSRAKLANASTLVARIGNKAREVEEKMLQADAKLAEANRKSLELERKKQDLQSNESVLQSERRSFIAGRDAWEDTYSRHKEDLHEWERKLHEGEERLCEGRKIINSREEKVNEIERSVKQKEKELDEAHNKIESSILESKRKEDGINKRLLDLSAREEQAETIKKNLEKKENELLDLAKKLPAKERVELQKLKELEIETKSKALKEKEKSYKRAVASFEADKGGLLAQMNILEAKKSKIEKKRAEITSKELHVKEEIKRLKVTEDERATFSCLQSKLKDDIEACRLEKELTVKERDDLRNDVVKFEAEWEALDENRSVIAKELKEFNVQKNWERRQEFKELQKLIDAHNETLDSKRREFELEMEEKRESIENDMRAKLDAIKQKEVEINHKEENLKKREEVLWKKLESYNEKELEIEKLKEKKKSYKREVESSNARNYILLAEIELLKSCKSKIEKKRTRVKEEIERLKVTEDERASFSCLQLKLEDDIKACRLEKELIVKKRDDLRNDVVKFEVEWEALDENRSAIAKELKEFNKQKENWDRRQETELVFLEKEKFYMKDYIKRELEAVKLERETEESLLVAKYDKEHRNFLHELEQRKRDLEADFQNRQTKMVTDMQEKDSAFEEMREKGINYLKEVIRKDLEEVKAEREGIPEVKDKFALGKKITEQREGLISERNRFLSFFENLKNCGNCGEIVRNYERSELHLPEVIKDHFPLPRPRSEINDCYR